MSRKYTCTLVVTIQCTRKRDLEDRVDEVARALCNVSNSYEGTIIAAHEPQPDIVKQVETLGADSLLPA